MSPANTGNPVGWLKPHQAEERFLSCPFCGCDPNVLKLPSMTIPGQTVWAVECRNLGCVFQRSATYGLLRELARDWNNRVAAAAPTEET